MSTQQTTEQTAYERPENLKPMLAELFKAKCNRIMLVGINKANAISLHGAGPVSTRDALIGFGSALAHAYAELPLDQQRKMPFNAFMNQVAIYSAAYLHQISPQSPVFFSEDLTENNQPYEPDPAYRAPTAEELQADAELEEAAEIARQEYAEDSQQEQQVQEEPAKAEEVPVKKTTTRRKTSSAAKSPVRRTTKPKAV